MDADDEIRIVRDGWRLPGDDVKTLLLSRGWAVADLDVGDDEPLEFLLASDRTHRVRR